MFRDRKYRWLQGLFWRPTLPFAVQALILAPLVLATDIKAAAAAYAFASPWLLPLLAILNLPFVRLAFMAFRQDLATRRNHALEHATIIILEVDTGRRFAGRCARNGFRIAGPATAKEIRTALARVRRTLQAGEPLRYISSRCGSNMVTALALGMVLLLLLAILSVAFDLPRAIRAGGLVAVIALFVALRRGVGNVIQRRFFIAVDFRDVIVRDVRAVRRELFERGPVHFVETIVVPRSSSGSPVDG